MSEKQMKDIRPYLPILSGSILFHGVAPEDILHMIGCLSVVIKEYEKGQYIHHAGDRIATIGLVLSGQVHVIKEDFWGNRSIMAAIRPCGLFGEAYAISGETLEVSAMAADAAQIMFFSGKRVLETCPSSCAFHTALIANLLRLITHKTLLLSQKIEHLSKRTTRDKLLSYFSSQAVKCGKAVFEIPFNRSQLAEDLSVDRSAMTTELGRMRDEGLIDFEKNRFELKEPF
jgi:CRP-like cAMP-binding protein